MRKTFGILGIFGYLHGFGAISFGFLRIFGYLQCFWRLVPPHPGKYTKTPKKSKAEGAKTMQIPKNSKNAQVFQTIGLRGWYPAWRGGWRVVRKTFGISGIFGYLHGFGAISFGFFRFFFFFFPPSRPLLPLLHLQPSP